MNAPANTTTDRATPEAPAMPRHIHPAMGRYYVEIDIRIRAIDEASAEYREAVANAEADRARVAAERLAGLLNVPVWVP